MSLPAPSPLSGVSADDVVAMPDGSVQFHFSRELSCFYDHMTATLWSNWNPRGVPCFSTGLLHDLERGSQIVEGYFFGNSDRPLSHVVLRSSAPGVFNLGGDLGHFLRLIEVRDRARLTEYARAAINVAYRNYTAHGLRGVTTIALLEGDALGGGFESALSCNLVVAERHVRCAFPEVLFDMFPGMGGLSFIARRASRAVANEIARTGRQYTADELQRMGVIDMVVETGQGTVAVNKLIRQRANQSAAHAAMNEVERIINPVTLQELNDIVRLWVDCAVGLSDRGKAWMQRLHQQQIAMFGRQLAIASSRT
jgi:DSF synthase